MHRVTQLTAALLGSLLTSAASQAAPSPIPEIVVVGDYRDAELMTLPDSVTIIEDRVLRERGQHLEDVLALAPNVNLSSGASRARFFQIRGIGERGQFAEPLNSSVGVIVDDVDLTGAATAASLFDMRQVEVFRGPQGTRYGANAHAGLIVMESNAPTATPEAAIELEAGRFDSRRAGAVLSGPLLGDRLLGRIAVQHFDSDGWMDNDFLSRDDTAGRSETLYRARLQWLPTEDLQWDLILNRTEIDNGYDAFTLDNSYTSLADKAAGGVQFHIHSFFNTAAVGNLVSQFPGGCFQA